MTNKEILKEIIVKLYDIECCTGDWQPDCADTQQKDCIACCRGRELIKELDKKGK